MTEQQWIEQMLATAPPLSDEQRRRITRLLAREDRDLREVVA